MFNDGDFDGVFVDIDIVFHDVCLDRPGDRAVNGAMIHQFFSRLPDPRQASVDLVIRDQGKIFYVESSAVSRAFSWSGMTMYRRQHLDLEVSVASGHHHDFRVRANSMEVR